MDEIARYLTDDRDEPDRHELHILHGGNGDWYVSVAPEGGYSMRGVRICTSGGAQFAAPGLGVAIAQAYRAIRGEREEPADYFGLFEQNKQLRAQLAAALARAEAAEARTIRFPSR